MAAATSSLEPDGVHRVRAVRREDGDGILIGPEGQVLPHLVDDQQFAALAGQLGRPVFKHAVFGVAGFRGESDDQARQVAGRPLRRAVGDQQGQDVRVADQGDDRVRRARRTS